MKITTLIENTTCQEDLACEHGLSLYLETGAHKILFDAGQSGAFADNADKLGIDLSAVDICILSHGHYDHGGGLSRFLEINRTAPVYLSRHAFGGHYNAAGKYIGLDLQLQKNDRLIYTDGDIKIAPGLTLHTLHTAPADTSGLTMLENGHHKPEDFRHEQYLLIEEAGKKILISGCSHKGILQIMAQFQPDVLIGGFHFMKIEDRTQLEDAAKKLLEYPTVYYTGHCTGQMQYAILKEIMGPRLQALSTGTAAAF